MKNRIIALLTCVLLALFVTAGTFTALADEGEAYIDTTPEEPIYTEPEPVVTDPEPVYTEADPEPVYTEAEPEPEPDPEPVYTQAEPDPEPQYNGGSSSSSDSGSNSSSDNYYTYEDDDQDDISRNNYPTAAEKAETSPVFNTKNRKISTDTLKKSDWAKIAEQLKKSGNDTGDDDFGFIRNNDPQSEDSGQWMLILGISLNVAAGIIIITLIVLAVVKRKKLAAGAVHSGSRKADAPVAADKQGSRAKESSKRKERQAKVRSKYDTAEIDLPQQKPAKSGGRYKPKH